MSALLKPTKTIINEFSPQNQFETLDIQFLDVNVNMAKGHDLENINVAIIKLKTKTSKAYVTISALDYLSIVSLYGLNTSLDFSLVLSSLPTSEKSQVSSDLISALDQLDIREFYRGEALGQALKLMQLEIFDFANLTDVQYNHIKKVLNNESALSPYSFKALISMFRLTSTLTNVTQAQLIASNKLEKWTKIRTLMDIVSEKKRLAATRSHINIGKSSIEIAYSQNTIEVKNLDILEYGFSHQLQDLAELIVADKSLTLDIELDEETVLSDLMYVYHKIAKATSSTRIMLFDGEAYPITNRHLKMYFMGYRAKISEEFDIKAERLPSFYEKVETISNDYLASKFLTRRDITFKSMIEDTVNLDYAYASTKYNRSKFAPLVFTNGLVVRIGGVNITLDAADLMDIHSGLRLPQSIINAGVQITERNFMNLDFIAHQYFIESKLYIATYISLLKYYGIQQFHLKELKVRDVSALYKKTMADSYSHTWLFLTIPYYSNLTANPIN